jgi:hypothetical protein
MGLKPGGKIDYQIAPDGSVRLSVQKLSFADSAGMLARPGQPALSIDEIDDGIAAAIAERLARC